MSITAAPALAHAPVRFSDLGVPRALSAALEERGIDRPFPIQAATLPDCLAGRDVCGMAPTGSGKTLAFGLAILSRLSRQSRESAKPRRGRRHPSALVLVPTRELAGQIEDVIAPLAATIGARVTSIYGGVGYGPQRAALRNGVDVVIACPGRLTDLLAQGAVRLSHVDVVVVDEADRMADMGFLPAVRRLLDMTSDSRQTLLFSATLDGPVDKLVRDYQHDPVFHEVASSAEDRGEVDHHFWRVEHADRVDVTADVVRAKGPALVFCRTKRGADRLSQRLGRSGLKSATIHGDRSQSQRERALAAFRGAGSTCSSRRTLPRGASTSMRCPWSSTSTRPPTTPTTCTARVAPAGPAPTASWSRWSATNMSAARGISGGPWGSPGTSRRPTSLSFPRWTALASRDLQSRTSRVATAPARLPSEPAVRVRARPRPDAVHVVVGGDARHGAEPAAEPHK